MRRKYDEGYALLYVLIIFLVLFAICAAICSIALQNHKGQVQSVHETRRLYQAEGKIEKFMGLAGDESRIDPQDSGDEKDTEEDAIKAAKEACWKAYKTALESCVSDLQIVTEAPLLSVEGMAGTETCKFSLTYQNEDVEIKTEVSVALSYKNTPEKHIYKNADGEIVNTTWTCTSEIESAIPTYLSYSITRLTEEGGDST